MNIPTLIRVGYMWQVTYASGEIKTHSQYWQALIYYHQAMECYQRDADSLKALMPDLDPMNHVESTSSITPSDL